MGRLLEEARQSGSQNMTIMLIGNKSDFGEQREKGPYCAG